MSYPQQPYGQYPPQQPGQPHYGPPPQQPYGYGPPVHQPAFVSPYPIADLGARVVQGLIDALLQLIPLAVGVLLIVAVSVVAYLTDTVALIAVATILCFPIVAAAWGVSFWNHVHRPVKTGTDQSIGMQKRNLRVVKLDGSPMTRGDHGIRWLLLVFVEGGLIALIVIACTERKQRLGDLAAKTVVVQLPPQ